MADKDPKKNGSIIDEIEGQLENILQQKKQDVEKALQEKIKREQEEAQKHLEALEQEMAKEKEALVTFQKLFAERGVSKTNTFLVSLDPGFAFATNSLSFNCQTSKGKKVHVYLHIDSCKVLKEF